MTPFRVLLLDIHEQDQLAWARDLAAPLGLDLEALLTPEDSELSGRLAATDGLVVHHRPVTAEVIAAAPHLRLIQKYGGRRDGIDVETARAHGAADAYLRLVVSRGEGELGVDPTSCPAPRVVCIAADVRLYPAEKLAEGLALVTSSLRRPGPDVLDPRVKSLNYLNNALAKLEARQRGADEALLLNAQGHVAEASAANVFAIRDGALATPPPTDGALAGITRMTVLELARELGLEAAERSLGRFDLFDAEEVFLTGTGARIVPVASLDGRPIGAARGPGPLTKRLTEAFDALARSTGTPF